MIEGVAIKNLRQIPDERGKIGHMLRRDDPIFERFGEVYFSFCYPGVVKGWHYHKKQSDNITVVKGMMKIVLYDSRENSPTKGELMVLFIGEDNPILVRIPPFVVHGFKAIGTETAIAVNCATDPYFHDDPDEFRIPPHDPSIPYDWSLKDG